MVLSFSQSTSVNIFMGLILICDIQTSARTRSNTLEVKYFKTVIYLVLTNSEIQ